MIQQAFAFIYQTLFEIFNILRLIYLIGRLFFQTGRLMLQSILVLFNFAKKDPPARLILLFIFYKIISRIIVNIYIDILDHIRLPFKLIK